MLGLLSTTIMSFLVSKSLLKSITYIMELVSKNIPRNIYLFRYLDIYEVFQISNKFGGFSCARRFRLPLVIVNKTVYNSCYCFITAYDGTRLMTEGLKSN